MDTETTKPKRRRPGPPCSRDGCGRSRSKGNAHCTKVCQLLDHEFRRLESVCRQAGPGIRSTEAWTALVGIADAWSEYVMVRGILNHIAARTHLGLTGSATTDATACTTVRGTVWGGSKPA